MDKIKKRLAYLLALCCISACVTGCANKAGGTAGENDGEYRIDFCGQEDSFEGAKENYAEGDKVSLTFGMIATDTDYSFYVDDEPFSPDYDSDKNVYKLKFRMPDHDIKVYYESRNTMEAIIEPEPDGPVGYVGENKPLLLLRHEEYINDDDEYEYNPDYYYTSAIEYYSVSDDHPALKEALDKIGRDTTDKYTAGLGRLKEEAADAFAAEGTGVFRGYYKNRRVSLCRADEVVMSYVEYNDVGLGPGCTYTTLSGRNLDSQTGEELILPEVITDINGLKDIVLKKAKEGDFNPVYEGIFERTMDEVIKENSYVSNDRFSWNVCYEGLWLHFPADLPYDVQGATCGRNTMFIPYEGNEEIFDEKYMDVPEAYCYDIEMMNGRAETYTLDVNGDGEYEDMLLTAIPNEDYGDSIEEINVIIGDGSTSDTITEDIWGYECKGVLAHTAGGENYLYISQMQENDYEMSSIYKVGDTLRYRNSLYGTIISVYTSENDPENMRTMTDPEDFLVSDIDYKMGTFIKYAHFKVGSGGSPELKDEYWKYPMNEYFAATTKLDIRLMKVDENGREIGLDTLKRNTGVRPYRTDDRNYLDIIDENGGIWRITLTKGPWEEDLLEEQRADELFDGLLYAG